MKPIRAPKQITWIAPIALIVALIITQWSHPNNRVARHFSARSALSLIGFSATGDFDGDLRLDQAELHIAGSHRCIRVRFGDSRESHLEFLSDYPDLELVVGDNDEHSYLTPDPDPALLTRKAIIESENHGDLFVARANGRRDLGLYLPYLRERGPPSRISFA